jgi:hypothetical protein
VGERERDRRSFVSVPYDEGCDTAAQFNRDQSAVLAPSLYVHDEKRLAYSLFWFNITKHTSPRSESPVVSTLIRIPLSFFLFHFAYEMEKATATATTTDGLSKDDDPTTPLLIRAGVSTATDEKSPSEVQACTTASQHHTLPLSLSPSLVESCMNKRGK